MASALSASLRVVTINSWKGDGPYGRRIEVLARQLAALEPDLVACQEVLHSADGALSTADTLAAALGMEAHIAPARSKDRLVEGATVATSSGLAILSRWPPTSSQTIALPSDPEDGERIAQLMTLDTPGGEVLVANTHLTHLRGRDDLRRAQLEVILGALESPRPILARLLCGDLNARPGSPAIPTSRMASTDGTRGTLRMPATLPRGGRHCPTGIRTCATVSASTSSTTSGR